jgi:hypothetical protein
MTYVGFMLIFFIVPLARAPFHGLWWMDLKPCIMTSLHPSLHLYNSSDATALVRIDTTDFDGSGGHVNSVNAIQSATPDNQAGWHDVTPVNEIKVTPNALETQPGKVLLLECVYPYIWSGSSSINIHLEPLSSAEVPLQIRVFSPGTYDLSNYILSWKLPSQGLGDSDETKQHSGK